MLPTVGRSIVGYHGTSRHAAARILAEGFEISRNEYDWLGDGVYFFQDAPRRAQSWAVERFGSEAAVVVSEIDLEGCLDLVDIGWASVLADAYDRLIALAKSTGTPLPRQTSGAHRLDRAVINYLADLLTEQGNPVRTVRAAFAEGSPAFPNSALFDLTHIQIAVRSLDAIKRSWLHEEGD